MAFTIHIDDFGLGGGRAAHLANGVGATLRIVVRRLTEALETPHQEEVDREMTRALARSGGRLTDSMEREVMQKVFASDWSLPQ